MRGRGVEPVKRATAEGGEMRARTPGRLLRSRLMRYTSAVALMAAVVASGQALARSGGTDERQVRPPSQGTQPGAEARQRRFETLMGASRIPAGSLIEGAESVQTLRIGLTHGSGTGPLAHKSADPASPSVSLRGRHAERGAPVIQRSQEVGADQLLIVALDRGGRARWSSTVPDPSIIRAEFPDSGGELSGHVLERPFAEVTVSIVDDPAIYEVHLYRPVRRVDGSVLAWLGFIRLG